MLPKRKDNYNKQKRTVRKTSSKRVANQTLVTNHPKEKRHWFRKLLLALILLSLLSILTLGVVFIAYYYPRVPQLNTKLFEYSQNAIIYDRNGDPYQNLQGEENRQMVSSADISDLTKDAFIAIEDKRFYEHHGVDLFGTGRAIMEVLLNRNLAGSGGSTITQQLIKQTHLTSEKTLERKFDEWILATRLEQVYTKEQILTAYLNKINFHGAEGIQAAARKYFGKNAGELDIAESAVLAAVPNSPSYFDPYTYDENQNIIYNPDGTIALNPNNLERATLVINCMQEQGFISPEQAQQALDEINNHLSLSFNNPNMIYSYFTDAIYEEVQKDLTETLNIPQEEVVKFMNTSGLKIYSTVDKNIQAILEDVSQNQTLYPPVSSEAIALSEQLGQAVDPEIGMTVIDNSDGSVVGIVGGRNNNASLSLNRARIPFQTGSSTKPITTYAPALEEKIITLAQVYEDKPIDISGWQPQNAEKIFIGPTTVRNALVHSINTVAVQAYLDLGLDNSLKYAEKLGLTIDEEDKNPASLALGGYHTGQTTVQMAAAFSTFPRGGEYIKPYYYTKVEDSNGNVLLSTPTQNRTRVFSPEASFLITDTLKQACTVGTANLNGDGSEIAGKTGTTDDFVTAYFCGYSPNYTIAVWNGYDFLNKEIDGINYQLAIGVPGGSKQGPAGFFESAIQQIEKSTIIKTFPNNTKLISEDLDSGNGQKYTEYFINGTQPEKESTDSKDNTNSTKKENQMNPIFIENKDSTSAETKKPAE